MFVDIYIYMSIDIDVFLFCRQIIETTPPFPARYSHSCNALASGKIIVSGGISNVLLTKQELFLVLDLAKAVWFPLDVEVRCDCRSTINKLRYRYRYWYKYGSRYRYL